jgi:hypothetical protein
MLELVMKSEELELLQDYLDGDDAAEDSLFARYDRELESPQLWAGIEAQIGTDQGTDYKWWLRVAAALLLTIGLAISYILLRSASKPQTVAVKENKTITVNPEPQQAVVKPGRKFKKTRKPIIADNPVSADNPGVLSTDLGYLDMDEQETARHIEQTENLLRSIRNFPISDTDDEIDVSYDKALSRRLLNENVVLRREAEMKAKFPTKTLLADLEPFLIDIANLPDQAKPEELRAIKERVQRTEIVAALLLYQDKGPNNR